jgi:two-component system NtrC family response regulator
MIVDDNEAFVATLREVVAHMGHEAVNADSFEEAQQTAQIESFDVVFLNTQLPDGRGIDLLPRFLESPSLPEVILFTDSGDPDEAELAIKMGAWDYVERPPTVKAITLSLVRALQYRVKLNPRCTATNLTRESFDDIIGSSPRMRACLDVLALAAGGDASVLLSGETGTGKELFAWAIHNNSSRAHRKFVVVDCAALPETLVESTLFGYQKGAFTGADKTQDGLVKRADGGTLFLDEVGELPLSVQKSFLRVLQEKRFRQVGGAQEIRSDFRLIAASNRDLDEMVHRRRFRKDLLFRLRAFSIEIPPLRERIEDIKELAIHHVRRSCECYGIKVKEFSPEFFDVLTRYDWPGNVRELVNALERAVSAARHVPVLFPKHLPTYIRIRLVRASVSAEGLQKKSEDEDSPAPKPLKTMIEFREAAIAEAEQRYLKELLSLAGTDVPEACRISGLSRSRLYALLKKYGIPTFFRAS